MKAKPATKTATKPKTKAPTKGKVGRPKGKRTDPTFRQVSAWIRRNTYDLVTIRLVEKDRLEFSVLVQRLLEDWLTRR